MIRRPPSSPLFPSTTLFRREVARAGAALRTATPAGQAPNGSAPNVVAALASGKQAGIASAAPTLLPPTPAAPEARSRGAARVDPKSTRLNSSHAHISYAVFF